MVRFHVRANSDSETDLALKYEVRDAVLALLAEDLQKAENDSEAILYLAQNLSEIRNTARAVVEEAGYHYDVKHILRERNSRFGNMGIWYSQREPTGHCV